MQVPNASPTAASASSDLYGGAVLDACQQIKARMEPVAAQRKHSTFAEVAVAVDLANAVYCCLRNAANWALVHLQLANLCFLERIDLSAHGFYITPDIGFDFSVGKGKPFSYFTFGAAFAEVEIDTLTGDFHTRRVDIVIDLGDSLNPAIDVGQVSVRHNQAGPSWRSPFLFLVSHGAYGHVDCSVQVEGAFIQGLGLVALEEVKWGDGAHPWVKPGHLFTQGPGSYKLPSANDVPIDFRVSLLKVSLL